MSNRGTRNYQQNREYCTAIMSFLTKMQYPEEDIQSSLREEVGRGWVVRWCWVNFHCRGVLLIRRIVGQGPTALVVGAGGGCLDIFSLIYHFSFLSPSLRETARYRLKYCLEGPLNLKQPTTPIVRKLTGAEKDNIRWS